MSSVIIWETARPVIADLSQKLGESCYGAQLDGSEVLYVVHQSAPQRFINIDIRVGSRLPAYCTSIGRVLLSGLSDEALDHVLSGLKPVAHTPNTVTAKGKLRDLIRETRAARQVRRRRGAGSGAALRLWPPSARARARSSRPSTSAARAPAWTVEEVRTRFLPELLEATQRINQLVRE